MFRYYYFFEKLKIVEKNLCKLNCSYGKVSHALKVSKIFWDNNKILVAKIPKKKFSQSILEKKMKLF